MKYNINSAPIIRSKDKKVIGTISKIKILQHLNQKEFVDQTQKKALKEPISKILKKMFVAVSPEMEIRNVLKIMNRNNLNQVPVINKGKLVGVLNLNDIINKITV